YPASTVGKVSEISVWETFLFAACAAALTYFHYSASWSTITRIITPMPGSDGDITQLLNRWREGSREAENELFALVLPNLRRLAHYLMKGERKGHSLEPTELVDQIYFRLVAAKNRDWQSRQHFFAIAGRAMRRHLIDHARARPHVELIALER